MVTSLNSVIKKHFKNYYFVGAFLTTSILFFFSGIFFGLDFTDTFYHLNQAINPPDGQHLFPILLSSLIIKTLIELIGPELITLRFVNSCLFFFSVLLPFLFIKTRASKIEVMFYVGCILCLIAPLNANVLGYDTLSIFINTLILSVTLLYLKKQNIYLLLILAPLSAMSVLIRLPNIIVLPIIIAIILFQNKFQTEKIKIGLIKNLVLFLSFSLLGVFLVYYLYYWQWSTFLESSLGSISHDLKILVYRYIRDGFKMILFCLFIISSFALFKQIKKYKNKTYAYLFNFLIYLFFVPFFLFAGYSYPLFLVAIAVSLLSIYVFNTSGKENKLEFFFLLVFVAFLFINPVGSNLGFLKASFMFLLFPFVLSTVRLKLKSFWISIIIVLIPFAVFGTFYRTYEDGNISTLNKTLEFDLLAPIKTSEERDEYLKKIDHEVRSLQDQGVQVYFYGDKSHIFHYLYPNSSLGIKAFNQPLDNLIFFPHIKAKVANKPKVAVFLTSNYPERIELKENEVKKELVKLGFKKILQKKSVDYYLKINY